jgi:hypothetical protein
MSMEIYALSDRQLTPLNTWQEAIDRLAFPLKLSAATPFASLHGALPVTYDRRETAFECDHQNAAELIADYSDVDFSHQWQYALAFRWGADLYAGVSAYIAAAAYAEATDGVVFDCQEGKIISLQRAAEIARELEQSQPLIEAAVRKVTEQFRK